MYNILLVGIGGGIGAILRYFISKEMAGDFSNTVIPLGTLTVNITGSFFIGIFFAFSEFGIVSERFRIFVVIGLLGGLTTFSTYSYETVMFFKNGNIISGLLNILVNNITSLILFFAGTYIGGLFLKDI